jgi:hypothetical protein
MGVKRYFVFGSFMLGHGLLEIWGSFWTQIGGKVAGVNLKRQGWLQVNKNTGNTYLSQVTKHYELSRAF